MNFSKLNFTNMNNRILKVVFGAISSSLTYAALLSICSFGLAQEREGESKPIEFPVYRLTERETRKIFENYYSSYEFQDLKMTTAALSSLKATNGYPTATTYEGEEVDRAVQGTSAVYASALPDPSLDIVVGTEAPSDEEKFDFKDTADSIQGFATMTAEGEPMLWLQGFGLVDGLVNSSWSTLFTNRNVYKQKVYLHFTLPEVKVSGETEEDAPAQWQSKFRVDVMVNGYPAWSSEAVRFNDTEDLIFSKPYYQMEFDEALGFDDSGVADSQGITLYLGTLDPLQTFELSLQLSGEIKLDGRCRKPASELFCSRANMYVLPQGKNPVTRLFLLETK